MARKRQLNRGRQTLSSSERDFAAARGITISYRGVTPSERTRIRHMINAAANAAVKQRRAEE